MKRIRKNERKKIFVKKIKSLLNEMDKKEIQKYYKNQLRKLKKHNKFTFKIANLKFLTLNMMNLKRDIIIRKKYDFLNTENSASEIVGYKPSKNFKKSYTEFQCYPSQMLLREMI